MSGIKIMDIVLDEFCNIMNIYIPIKNVLNCADIIQNNIGSSISVQNTRIFTGAGKNLRINICITGKNRFLSV